MRWMPSSGHGVFALTGGSGVPEAFLAALALIIVALIGLWGTTWGNRQKLSRMDDTLNRHHEDAPTLGEFLSEWSGNMGEFREFMAHFRDQWDGLRNDIGNAAKLNEWSEQVNARLAALERTGEATWGTVQAIRLDFHEHSKWCVMEEQRDA